MKMKGRLLFLILIILISYKVAVEAVDKDEPCKYAAFWYHTHKKITQKAINLLIKEGELTEDQINELKKYRKEIEVGSDDEDLEGGGWRPNNHAFDPDSYDPVIKRWRGKYGHASALDWAKGAYDPGKGERKGDKYGRRENEYDWYDALKYYLEKDNKDDAYRCLGHVCHLLQDVSVPGHTIPSIKDGEDEDGIKKGYPPLPHGTYEMFIAFNDDPGEGEGFLEISHPIVTKNSLDDFFVNIAKASKKFGKRFVKEEDHDDPDIYNPIPLEIIVARSPIWLKAQLKGRTEFDKIEGVERNLYSIYSEIAEEMVPLAVGYTAGFIKYFYDFIHLEVKRTSPQDGEEDVPIHTSITITFDQPIDPESFILDETFFVSPKTEGTFSLSQDKNTIIFYPEILKENTRYTVTIKGGIEGVRGEKIPINNASQKDKKEIKGAILPEDYIFTFRTEMPPDPPNNDNPDESPAIYSPVTKRPPNIDPEDAEIAVLKRGFPREAAFFLDGLGEKVAFLNLRFNPEAIAKRYPILFIPSGGLYGIEGSKLFRERLERYAEAGGVIICFSQQRGYEYNALPGGEMGGYGWREDQSCHTYAASLENFLPNTPLPTTERLNVCIDGSFTEWPNTSKVILRRVMNHLPAMLIYPYGKGYVIASTLYSDWAFNHQQGTKEELTLIDELITWAKKREKSIEDFPPVGITQEPEISFFITSPREEWIEGSEAVLTFHIHNRGQRERRLRCVYKRWAQKEREREIVIGPESKVEFSDTFEVSRRYGVFARLYDEEGRLIGRAERHIEGYHSSIDIELSTNEDFYIKGERVIASFSLKEKGGRAIDGIVKLVVTDPAKSKVFDRELKVALPHEEETDFLLPTDGLSGIYLLSLEFRYEEGGIIMRRTIHFEVMGPHIVITPLLPEVFGLNNRVGFELENVGVEGADCGFTLKLLSPDEDELFNEKRLLYIREGEKKRVNFEISIPKIELGTYTILYSLGYEGKEYTSQIEIPSEILFICELDKPSYRVGETILLNLRLKNAGRFAHREIEVLIQIPDCGFEKIEVIEEKLLPSQEKELSYAIEIPQGLDLYPGLHKILFSLKGKDEKKVIDFVVPEVRFSFLLLKDTFQAGDTLRGILRNEGGVNAQVEYELVLIGPYGVECAYLKDEVEIGPGDRVVIDLPIPGDLLSGDYQLICYLKEKALESFIRVVRIEGVETELEVSPEKEHYFPDDEKEIITRITEATGGNGILSLRLYSTQEDWRLYPEIEGSISSIGADEDYLWVGTRRNGLWRYNKRSLEWERLDTTNSGLFDDEVKSIWVDSKYVWFSHYYGITRFDKSNSTWHKLDIRNLGRYRVHRFGVGKGWFWLIGRELGFFKIHLYLLRVSKDFKDFKICREIEEPLWSHVWDHGRILVDENFLWVLSSSGNILIRFKKSDYTETRYEIGRTIYSFAQDLNSIWMGGDGKLIRLDKSTGQMEIRNIERAGRVYSIYPMEGYLWIGASGGLYTYNKETEIITKYHKTENLRVWTDVQLIKDGDTLWIASRFGLMSYGVPTTKEIFFQGEPYFELLCKDKDSFWLYSKREHCLGRYEEAKERWRLYRLVQWEEVEEIVSLGNWIFGRGRDKLFGFDKEKEEEVAIRLPEEYTGITPHFINDMEADGAHLWIVTIKDLLLRYNPGGGTWKVYDLREMIKGEDYYIDIDYLKTDSSSVWLLDDYNGRLFRFDKEEETVEELAEIGYQEHVRIEVDHEYLWFVTEEGIHRYSKKDGNLRVYSFDEPLGYDFQTTSDGKCIWILGPKGAYYELSLLRFDKIDGVFTLHVMKGLDGGRKLLALDRDSLWIVRWDGGIERYYFRRLIWEKELNVSLSPQEIRTELDELGMIGKFEIEATLRTERGQVIASDTSSLYILPKVLYATLSIEKRIYKPGEPIRISGKICNASSKAVSNFTFILTKEDEILLKKTISLPKDGEEDFMVTTTSNSSFLIKAKVGDFVVSEYIEVVSPELEVKIDAPEVVGRGEFLASILLKNTGKVELRIADCELRILNPENGEEIESYKLPLTNYELSPGKTKVIEQKLNITQDVVLKVEITGDLNKTITKEIRLGERVTLEVKPKAIYPVGVLEIPFALTNSGELDSEVEVVFTLKREKEKLQNVRGLNIYPSSINQLPGWCKRVEIRIRGEERSQNANLSLQIANSKDATTHQLQVTSSQDKVEVKKEFYIPVGERIEGTLVFELSEGDYILKWEVEGGKLGVGSVGFRVAKDNIVEIVDIRCQMVDREDGRLPINVKVKNIGGNRFFGNLRLDTGFYEEEMEIELESGGEKSYTFEVPLVASAGSYIAKAEVLHNGRVIFEKSEEFSLEPGFEITKIQGIKDTVVMEEGEINFDIGREGRLRFTIKNTGTAPGEATLHLKLLDLMDELRQIYLDVGEEGKVEFSFLVPDDYEDRDYEGDCELRIADGKLQEERIIRFHINGVKIGVEAWLDKQLYEEGEKALLEIKVENLSFLDHELSMYAKVIFNEYEERKDFVLGEEPVTLIFSVPVEFTHKKIGYGVYTSSGRSIYLNSIYIREKGKIITLWTDKDIYNAGDEVGINYIIDGSWLKEKEGVKLKIEVDTGFKEEIDIKQVEGKLSFKLQDELTSGTYSIDYRLSATDHQPIRGVWRFDVRGYKVKVLEAKLDKEVYIPGEDLRLDLLVESNKANLQVLFKGWVYGPDGKPKELFTKLETLPKGHSTHRLTGKIKGSFLGIHRLVYAIYKSKGQEQGLLLVSGAETFDLGGVILLGISTDKPIYYSKGPIILTIRTIGMGRARFALFLDDLSFRDEEEIEFDGTGTTERILEILKAGRYRLKARLKIGDAISEKETVFNMVDEEPPTTNLVMREGCWIEKKAHSSTLNPQSSAISQIVASPENTYALSAQDNFAIEEIEYSLDGAPFQPYTHPISIKEEGEHTLLYRARDVNGNVEKERSLRVFVDASPPKIISSTPKNMAYLRKDRLSLLKLTLSEGIEMEGVKVLEKRTHRMIKIRDLAYDKDRNLISFRLDEDLKDNHEYEIELEARDLVGNPLIDPRIIFYTLTRREVGGVVEGDGAGISIPPFALKEDAYIRIERSNEESEVPDSSFEYTAVGKDGDPITSFRGIVRIWIFYKDKDGDGILDGMGIREDALRIGHLGGDGWRMLPTSKCYPGKNMVEARTDHISTYGLMVYRGDLDEVINYPNPFDMTKYDHINFGPLPIDDDLEIRIYTLDAELVRVLDSGDEIVGGQATWDGENEDGERVASGIYIYLVRCDGEKKVGKITVIK
jgi:hypothetical protein